MFLLMKKILNPMEVRLLCYRDLSRNFNLYTSKTPRNTEYFDTYKLSSTI